MCSEYVEQRSLDEAKWLRGFEKMGELSQQIMGGFSLRSIEEYECARQQLEQVPEIFRWMSVHNGYGALTVGGVEDHSAMREAIASEVANKRLAAYQDLRSWYKLLDHLGPFTEGQWREILSWLSGEWPAGPITLALRGRLEELRAKCQENAHLDWVGRYEEVANALLALKF